MNLYPTFEDFLTSLSPQQRSLTLHLRDLLLNSATGIYEKMSYGLAPFYYRHSRIWYLWPVEDGIELGFCKGHLHPNTAGLLENRGRKEVSSVTFTSLKEILQKEDALYLALEEALALDTPKVKKKKA